MALFSAIIIGRPQNLFGLIPGFPGEGGFRRFYHSFGIPWSYPPMAYRTLGAPLRSGALIGGPPNGYTFIFYFSFRFREISKYIWPIGEPPGRF